MIEFLSGVALSGHNTCPQLDIHTDPVSLQIVNVRYVRDAINEFALSLTEAPTDGFVYARRGSDATWQGLTRINNVTVLGEGALASLTTGQNNTALGWNALNALTTGGTNTAIGSGALRVNNTTGNNTAVGFNALAANHTWGAGNTAVGGSALVSNVSGTVNTAVGSNALSGNIGGSNNTALGGSALGQNIGDRNTAIGQSAMSNIAGFTSVDNVVVGQNAGSHFGGGLTTAVLLRNAVNSVFIGARAQPQADGQSNQIAIGFAAVGRGSNTAVIGNADVRQLWLGDSRVWPVEYSTEERVTGVWVDGSPIYQRSYQFVSPANSVPHNISDIGFVISIDVTNRFMDWRGLEPNVGLTSTHINGMWAGTDENPAVWCITLRYTKLQS